ncbi:MAG: HipA domain-containing protein [Acidimicrobiales bacterium]
MSPKRLGVWLDGTKVATLEARKPWDLRCRYEPAVVAQGEANRPLLSCSLPVTRQAANATAWVRGLLPEGNHLLALATRARLPTNHFAGLLERYGRDIAGAFSISAEPPEPRAWAVEPYSEDELVAELRDVVDAPGFAVRDDSELSIAGLQNKLLVNALPDGRWGRPRNGQPSTHIMKLADGRHDGLLAAEHACMQLARAVGLTTVNTDLANFDGIDVLIVPRYDRDVDPRTGDVRRIHQEDSCQALAVDIDAHQGRGKYERFGGPSFGQIADLLDRYGDPALHHPRLVRTMVFTAAIGNGDAHGKNVSLLVDTATGSIAPAPLYDTVPTALWPQLREAPAMSVNGTFRRPSFQDFIGEARRWGMGTAAAEQAITEATAAIRGALGSCPHVAVAELVSARLDGIDASHPGV